MAGTRGDEPGGDGPRQRGAGPGVGRARERPRPRPRVGWQRGARQARGCGRRGRTSPGATHQRRRQRTRRPVPAPATSSRPRVWRRLSPPVLRRRIDPSGPQRPHPTYLRAAGLPPADGPCSRRGVCAGLGCAAGAGLPPRPGANRLPLPVDATQPRGAYADAGMGARSPGAGMRGPGGGPGPAAFGAPPPGHPVFAPDDRISSMGER